MANNSPSGKILINGSTGQRLVSKEQSSFTLYPDEVAVFALNGTNKTGLDFSNTYVSWDPYIHYPVINLYTPKYHDDGTLNGVPEKIEFFENVDGLGEKVTWDSNLGDTSGYFIHLQIPDFRLDGYSFFENSQKRLQVTTSEKLKVARYEQNDFFPLLGFATAVNPQREGNGGYAVSWGGWEILHPITVGETLEADMRHIEDPDGLGAFSYQWLIDGIPIYGATSDTYVPKDTDTNRNISLQVSYLDDNKTLETLNTSTFLVVPNILATGSLTIDGDFAEGQRLMANTSAIEDEDGIGVFYYQWLKNDNPISGSTGSGYVLQNSDIGASISLRANYIDGNGSQEIFTSSVYGPVENVNFKPTGSPEIHGNLLEGETLWANTHSIADADGLGAFSYQWLRDGRYIDSATSEIYVLTPSDVGSKIAVLVYFTDGDRTFESVTSKRSGPVENVNFDPTGLPEILGERKLNAFLTSDISSVADDDGLGSFNYEWLRDGASVISELNNRSYLKLETPYFAIGDEITLRVSYTDQHGTIETLTSQPFILPVPAHINRLPTGSIEISGTARAGSALIADTSSILDADGFQGFDYQWFRGTEPISKANNSSYVLHWEDVGKDVSVRISYTDYNGTFESVISSTIFVDTNNRPIGSVIISGNLKEGELLTSNTDSISDSDGLGEFSYQWMKNNFQVITGANDLTYLIKPEDIGDTILLEVSYTDLFGTTEYVYSPVSTVVENVNDLPEGAVEIVGALSVGETITAYTDKVEDKDGLGELSYQWFNNAISINDATEKVYNLTVGDAGDDLSVIVKFLDEQGTEETITSFPVSINNATEQNGGIYTVNSSTFESPTIDFYLREEYDPTPINWGIEKFSFDVLFDASELDYVASSYNALSYMDGLRGTTDLSAVATGKISFEAEAPLTPHHQKHKLFSIEFDTLADVEEIILIVTNVNVDDHILDPSTVIINPTVSPRINDDMGTYNISASIVTQNAIKLADVDVIFNQGINSSSYKSTADGSVSGALTAGSAATVKASLAYSSLTKAISSQDALDALKLSVGLSTSQGTKTAFDFMSADFNQDGKVSSQDALSILKYSVGLTTPEQAKWVFVDTNGDFSEINKLNTSYTEGVSIADLSADTTVSLTGILIGDVNDSYSGLIA